MKYKLVQAVREENQAATFVVSEFDDESLLPAMEVRGFTVTGRVDAARYMDGRPRRIPLRSELHGQPQFSGLCGPMYDGPGVIRYEDATANDILSV